MIGLGLAPYLLYPDFSFVNKNKSMIFLFNCFTMIILKLLVLGYSLLLLLLFLYLTKEKFISFCIFGLTG